MSDPIAALAPDPAAPCPDARVAVIIGHPGMGDMVWHQPILQAIARHHGAPVTLFARPSTLSAVLFDQTPEVARVVSFVRKQGLQYLPALFDLIGELRRGRFNRVYVLNRRPVLAAVAAAASIPERYGFGAPGQRLFLNRGRPVYDGKRLIGGGPVVQCGLFLERNGIAAPTNVPMLQAPPAARARARERYAGLPRPWVALGVTVNDEDRRWIPSRFAELAVRIEQRFGGTMFIHGGPHHRRQVDDVIERLPTDARGVVDLSRETVPFEQIMGLLAESDIFIGNDSGPLNVSAAVGIPAFGLFGSAAPHASLSPKIHAILPDTGEPDRESGMQRLSVDKVMAAIEDVLAGRSG
jgi:heptosyltransferase-2